VILLLRNKNDVDDLEISLLKKCGRVSLIQPDSIPDYPIVGLLFSKI
jgi:hypothetical protein